MFQRQTQQSKYDLSGYIGLGMSYMEIRRIWDNKLFECINKERFTCFDGNVTLRHIQIRDAN